MVSRAEGVYLYDDSGRAILDGASGAAVVCLGHSNRRIVARLAEQAAQVAFAHTSTFLTRPVLELTERIAAAVGDPSARVYLVSGGSEGTETALKLARAYQIAAGRSNRHVVISRSISYHGATLGALAMTGLRIRRQPYEPMLVPSPRIMTAYCYRCPMGLDAATCGDACADDLERAVATYAPDSIAAFIVEPIIGASAPGVTAPTGYMQRIAETCRRHGILLIADEVMSGVGRTGTFLGIEHYGVRADITVLSKGLSSGYAPLAAVVVRDEIFDALRCAGSGEFIHGFTYSGNPVAAAVGLEVLDILEEDQLVPRVARIGELLFKGLVGLRQYPIVGDIRGKGLLTGVEFVADQATRRPFPRELKVASRVQRACLAEGLYVYPGTGSVDGLTGDHILIAPPYIITEDQVNELVQKLASGIQVVSSQLDGSCREAHRDRHCDRSLTE
jgi:adenosylmethionine-8-amino-7-oxononanoate aminotransferase